jgi:outer membrane protein insertion porin family
MFRTLLLATILVALCAAIAGAQEGVRIDRVEVKGNHRVEEEAIRVQLRSQAGLPYSPTMVDSDIRALYRMSFFDDVEADLTEHDGKWTLTYTVKERPLVREVRIEGNKALDKEDMDKQLKVRPQTILDPTKIRRSIADAKKEYEKKGYLDAEIRDVTEPVGDQEVVLIFKITEGEQIKIEDVRFEGARAFSAFTLRNILQTRRDWLLGFFTGAGNLDREVLKTDVERLTAYYYDNGYIDVRIDEPKVERKDDGIYVTFKIDEGNVYKVGVVGIDGDTLPQNDVLVGELDMKPGETFRASHLRQDITKLTEKYGDEGYAFVNIVPDTDVHPTEETVDIVYRVSKGPAVSFDRIEISGNTKTRDKVIRRELRVQEQQRFSGSGLRVSQERLRRLGFFEDVNLTTRRAEGQPDKLNLLVDVKEGPTGSFAAGAGISSGESFLFNVRLSEINLFGRGQRLVLNADIGSIRRNFTVNFTEPYLFETDLLLGLEAFNWRLEFADFTREGTGGSVRFLYPLPALGFPSILGFPLEDTSVGLEYRIEKATISDVSPFASTAIQIAQGSLLASGISPQVYRDTRNHPFDPTAGSVQSLQFEVTGLGGNAYYYKGEARGRWYIPFYRNQTLGTFVFSQGLDFAAGRSYRGPSPELPLFERYFPGGINSNRGYEVRTLGPQVPVFNSRGQLVRLDTIGGSQQFISNTEIIFPIVEALGLRGLIFFDAGQAFTVSQGVPFDELRLAFGPGIRWLSPIGPLRIEIGFPINRRSNDKSTAIGFSFGAPP